MLELEYKIALDFLAKNNITNCDIKKIAGDASFRSYYRISRDKETHILMFAPPKYEEIKPFIKISQFLLDNNFSAPSIKAIDHENGFLLLDDFGDDTYGRILAKNLDSEAELYQKACDCLLELHKVEVAKDVPIYNHDLLISETMLFIDWYLPFINKKISLQEKAKFKALFFELIDQLSPFNSIRTLNKATPKSVMILRDYHADNLMLLKNKTGIAQVGLLDFQDAVIGSRAYDLVSLLEDARRDVNPELRAKIFNHYLKNCNCDINDFKNDYEILSLQRNIKILGIFARLSLRDGKDNYLSFLPRVVNLVKMRLESDNEILLEIANFIKKML